MNSIRIIRDSVFAVGVQDWDRRLFDELIPLPEGTSYNSYVVVGTEKTALIDTVDPSKTGELFEHLDACGIKNIDYIVTHHAEQDHSGSLPAVLQKFPLAKVVTNAKCRDFLCDLLLIQQDRFLIVEDRQTLSLGGRTLEFLMAPWVHWPETMLTYLVEDKILFTCDLFGSHLATSDVFVKDWGVVERAAKRYYAEIMMPFRAQIKKHLEKMAPLSVDLICPSHGPVYSGDNVPAIIAAYKNWISDQVVNEVIIPYVSMHGSVAAAVDILVKALSAQSIPVKPFNLTKTDLGELAMALVDAATVIVATPTVLLGAHPQVTYATTLINALKPKTKYLGLVVSYGWGSKVAEQITAAVSGLKVETLPPVIFKGHPKGKDCEALEQLVKAVAEKHRGI